MSKKPTAETELRRVRSDLNNLRKAHGALKANCEHYRIMATKAEQEVAEWKARFDALLRRDQDRMVPSRPQSTMTQSTRPAEQKGG